MQLQRNLTTKEASNFLIMKWNPALQGIPKWAREFWAEKYDENPDIQGVTNRQLIVSWQRPKNLQDTLMRAVVPTPENNEAVP